MAKIAIVGAGIAGLYCASELSERNHTVTVFEALDRLGGRIETQDLQGFKAECGPMRFELEIEPFFEKLTKDTLQITFGDFPPTKSGNAEFPKYELQPNEMSAEQKSAAAKLMLTGVDAKVSHGINSHHTKPLDLLKYGLYRIFHREPAELALGLEDVVSGDGGSRISLYAGTLEDEQYNYIRTKQTLDGVRLFALGFWNALSRVLSPGAVAKIRETGTFYHLLPENPSASEWSIFWLRLFKPNAKLSTIKAGVEIIVKRLEDKLAAKSNLTILRRTVVERVFEDETGKLRVSTAAGPFQSSFDHVILAIPAVPLQALADNFPREIREYVRGVIPFPLTKIFVVIRKPWWKALPQPQEGAHLVPTREVHYFPGADVGQPNHGMVMFYTDRPATSYWHSYVRLPHNAAQIDDPVSLEHELALQLSRLLPSSSPDSEAHLKRVRDSIVSYAIRDWSKPPFGAACHAWAPNIRVPTALDHLKAFSLKGASGTKNVHVCGEAYSDYQGFIEGALKTAAAVVATI